MTRTKTAIPAVALVALMSIIFTGLGEASPWPSSDSADRQGAPGTSTRASSGQATAQKKEAPPATASKYGSVPADQAGRPASPPRPVPSRPSGIFSLYVDNDLFAGTDRDYTNGIRLVWVSPDLPDRGASAGGERRWYDRFAGAFGPARRPGAKRFVSFFAGQSMYTPIDIDKTDLIPSDRPYAGYAYAGLGLHAIRERSMGTLEITAGIVGPGSLAGDFQKLLHRAFGFIYPRGWENQIPNEPTFGLAYDRKLRLRAPRLTEGISWDAVVHGGASLSNVLTAASAGVEIRAGWNIPMDFGTGHLQPGAESATLFEERSDRLAGKRLLGVHAYLAFEGHAVARDVFLDGTMSGGCHHVDKIPWRADTALGVALRWRRVKLSYGYVVQTRQFESQRKPRSSYGSLNLSFAL